VVREESVARTDGPGTRCVIESTRQSLADGYQSTTAHVTVGERLAVYIGPMAKVLVKRAAEQARGTRDLYERLARHIDDPGDRRQFTAATEELTEP
jgi:hypothetical protein